MCGYIVLGLVHTEHIFFPSSALLFIIYLFIYLFLYVKKNSIRKFGKILKSVLSAHQDCIYLVKNTVKKKKKSNIVKYYFNLK